MVPNQQPAAFSGLSPQNFSLKEFLMFFPKKTCSKKRAFLIFLEMKLCYIFSEKSSSCISGNGIF